MVTGLLLSHSCVGHLSVVALLVVVGDLTIGCVRNRRNVLLARAVSLDLAHALVGEKLALHVGVLTSHLLEIERVLLRHLGQCIHDLDGLALRLCCLS